MTNSECNFSSEILKEAQEAVDKLIPGKSKVKYMKEYDSFHELKITCLIIFVRVINVQRMRKTPFMGHTVYVTNGVMLLVYVYDLRFL